MNLINIIPLIGIEIINGDEIKKINFGLKDNELIHLLGKPLDTRKDYSNKYLNFYYKNNFLQLFLGIDKLNLSYIEISYNINTKVQYENLDIFKVKYDILVNSLLKTHILNNKNQEIGYSYIFNDIELSLRRPVIYDPTEEIEGESDYEKGLYFSSVGIGIKGYRSNFEFK